MFNRKKTIAEMSDDEKLEIPQQMEGILSESGYSMNDFISSNRSVKPEQLREIDIDDRPLIGERYKPRGISKKLTMDDKETYRELKIIHEMGDNFWPTVKRIVESRKEIKLSDCDDNVDLRKYL